MDIKKRIKEINRAFKAHKDVGQSSVTLTKVEVAKLVDIGRHLDYLMFPKNILKRNL